MALPYEIAKLEDVPEALREHYVNDNGRLLLAANGQNTRWKRKSPSSEPTT